MSRKILITGANGFLGSAITKLAVKKGYKVSVLVRKNSNLDNLIKFKSKITHTFLNGTLVYKNSKLCDKSAAMQLTFNR